MAWDTADNILNDAALELGLLTAAVSDPYASTNQNIIQLRALLKRLGQNLLRDYSWSHLQTPYTFVTANGTASYALQTDFARFIDGTAYNQTTGEKLRGPLNAQEWEALQAGTITLTGPRAFRIYNNKFYLYSTPTAVETIGYEYQSTYWVQPVALPTPTSETPTTYNDTLCFDRRLLVDGLQTYFRAAKGFISGEERDYEIDRLVRRAAGADGAAPVLSLNGSGLGVRLIDQCNLPDTGYGG